MTAKHGLVDYDDAELETDEGDDFLHILDTDEELTDKDLLGENPYIDEAEEEDLEHWSETKCPKCGAKFDLTKCRTSGENIICPNCHALL